MNSSFLKMIRVLLFFFCFINFFLCYSQKNDTLYLRIPNTTAIYSPCPKMTCIDSSYIVSDTLTVIFTDNREYNSVRVTTIQENSSPSYYVEMHTIMNTKQTKQHVLVVILGNKSKYDYLIIRYVDYSFYFKRIKQNYQLFEYVQTTENGVKIDVKNTWPMRKRKWE